MFPRRSPRTKKTGVQGAPVATPTTDGQALQSPSSSSSREQVNGISMPVTPFAPAPATVPSSQDTAAVLGLHKIWQTGNTAVPFGQWIRELLRKPSFSEAQEVGPSEGASMTATDGSTPEPLPSTTSSPLTPTSELPDYFPSFNDEDDPSDDSAQPADAEGPMLPNPTNGWAPLCWTHKFLQDKEFKLKKQYFAEREANQWNDVTFAIKPEDLPDKSFPLMRVLCILCNRTVAGDFRSIRRHCDTLDHLARMSQRLGQQFKPCLKWKCDKCDKCMREDVRVSHKRECLKGNNPQPKRQRKSKARKASDDQSAQPPKKRVRTAAVDAPVVVDNAPGAGVAEVHQESTPTPAFYPPGDVPQVQHQNQHYQPHYQGPPPSAVSGSRSSQPQGQQYPFTFYYPAPGQLAHQGPAGAPVPVPGLAPPYYAQQRGRYIVPAYYTTPADFPPFPQHFAPSPSMGIPVSMHAQFPAQGNVREAEYMTGYYDAANMAQQASPAAVTAPPAAQSSSALKVEDEDAGSFDLLQEADATLVNVMWPADPPFFEVDVSADELEAVKFYRSQVNQERTKSEGN